VNPPGLPQATPAPLHDIVDAVPIFPYPLWLVIIVGAAALSLLAWLIWFFFVRRKPAPPLSPRERAIAGLVRLQAQEASPYEFAVMISDVLRQYLDEAFGLRATTATSLEFLESLRDTPTFQADEKASLAHFLQVVDLIKFARVEAQGEELAELFRAAEAVVRKEAAAGGTAP
jgi:hypothetical protein